MKHLLFIIAIFVAICVLCLATNVYLYAQKVERVPTDAAIVLGAAAFGDEPSPVLRERIHHAILLYEQGYVKSVIFTGGKGATGNAAEAVVAANYAEELGLPKSAILIEAVSRDTKENLAMAQVVADQHELHTFLIVSTPFHMKRAMAISEDLGLRAYSSPTQTIQWISWYTKTRAFVQEVGSYILYLLEKWGMVG